MLKYIPKEVRRVLDVGCSIGSLGKALKARQPVYVVGIEIDSKAANIASNILDKVIIGNADTIDLSKHDIPKKYFDCIIYSDVLEHCMDPWQIVKMHKKFLSDEGVIIVSIPNIRHYTVIFNLLKGDFPYRYRGLHDRTHLRWFTKKTAIELFKNNNYEVSIVQRKYRIIEKNINTKFASYANFIAKYIATVLYPFREFFVFQYILFCRPINSHKKLKR